MDRAQYNNCMRPYMKGQGLNPQERKMQMCIGAKMCSGKANNTEEAEHICLTQPPKEAKSRSSRRQSSKIDFDSLAACALPKIYDVMEADEDLNEKVLSGILLQCGGGAKKAKTDLSGSKGKKKFMTRCYKENSSTGTLEVPLPEAGRLKRLCDAAYKEAVGVS